MRKILTIILSILLIPNLCWAGIDFDSVDDSVDCGSAASLDNLGPLTVSVWIYPETEGEANEANIVAKHTGGSAGRVVYMQFYDAGTNALRFFKNTTGTSIAVNTSNSVVTLNTWQHVLVIWDGGLTATNVHFYVNGTEVSYVTQTNGTGTISADAALNFKIGNQNDGAATFDGIITEAAVWNMVLSASQIALLASSRLKGIPLQLTDPDADGTQELVGYWPMDEGTHGNSADLDTAWDLSGNGNNGNPDNGGNNTGMSWSSEVILNYPSPIITGM